MIFILKYIFYIQLIKKPFILCIVDNSEPDMKELFNEEDVKEQEINEPGKFNNLSKYIEPRKCMRIYINVSIYCIYMVDMYNIR